MLHCHTAYTDPGNLTMTQGLGAHLQVIVTQRTVGGLRNWISSFQFPLWTNLWCKRIYIILVGVMYPVVCYYGDLWSSNMATCSVLLWLLSAYYSGDMQCVTMGKLLCITVGSCMHLHYSCGWWLLVCWCWSRTSCEPFSHRPSSYSQTVCIVSLATVQQQ